MQPPDAQPSHPPGNFLRPVSETTPFDQGLCILTQPSCFSIHQSISRGCYYRCCCCLLVVVDVYFGGQLYIDVITSFSPSWRWPFITRSEELSIQHPHALLNQSPHHARDGEAQHQEPGGGRSLLDQIQARNRPIIQEGGGSATDLDNEKPSPSNPSPCSSCHQRAKSRAVRVPAQLTSSNNNGHSPFRTEQHRTVTSGTTDVSTISLHDVVRTARQ